MVSTDITLPAGSKYDRIFEIAAEAVTRGLKTQLKIEGGNSSTAVLKTRGKLPAQLSHLLFYW